MALLGRFVEARALRPNLEGSRDTPEVVLCHLIEGIIFVILGLVCLRLKDRGRGDHHVMTSLDNGRLSMRISVALVDDVFLNRFLDVISLLSCLRLRVTIVLEVAKS